MSSWLTTGPWRRCQNPSAATSGRTEDRYQVRSTILTSQLPVSRWHEQLGDPTLADGILDRLDHNAHRIEMRRLDAQEPRETQQLAAFSQDRDALPRLRRSSRALRQQNQQTS